VRAGRREKRLLNAKAIALEAVALRTEATVAGKISASHRGANVIDLFAGGEGRFKRDADH